MTSPTILTAFLVTVVANLALGVPQTDFLRLVSGRQIPLHILRLRIPTVTPAELPTRIYEISNSFLLTGHDRAIDLHILTSAFKPVSVHKPHVFINGKEKPYRISDGRVRTGAGYTVAHMGDGQVVGVWGNGISLEPLNHATHPGVFINVMKRTVEGTDLRDDVRDPTESSTRSPHLNYSNSDRQESTKTRSSLRQWVGSCRRQKVTKEVDVAITFDNQRCAQHGNDAQMAVLAVITALAEAAEPFRKQTCLRLKVVAVEGFCQDPNDPFQGYEKKETGIILDEFSGMWKATRANFERDILIYLPGFASHTNVSGMAFIGGACSASRGYCWAAEQDPFVMAHEMGHLLKAVHTDLGVMRPSFQSGDNLRFSGESVAMMADFIDNDKQSECITKISEDKLADTPGKKTVTVTAPSGRGGSGTCGGGFDDRTALSCSKSLFTIPLNHDGEVIGETNMSLRQRSGKFHIKFSGIGDVRIKSMKNMLSFTPGMTQSDIGKGHDYAQGGRKVVRAVWNADELPKRDSVRSCCGKTLHIYVFIEHCDTAIEVCESKFFSGKTVVECSVCRRSSFQPMSVFRECPVCRPVHDVI